jgi:phosphoglucosamine mutase
MTVYPQALVNVDVRDKPDLESIPEISQVIRNVETELKGKGRVLVRYYGTQPQCRIMVEAPTESDTRRCAEQIAGVVNEKLGIKKG